METQKNNLSRFDIAVQRRSDEHTTSLLKSSIAKEENGKKMASKIVALEEEKKALRNLLEVFVQQFECTFSQDENMSVEFAEKYIEAATYLRDTYKRKGDIITHVELWIEEEMKTFKAC